MKIGLIGKMRSGKDTVADYLKEYYNFKSVAFADGIRVILNEFFPSEMEKGKPRHHYQHVGQALRELNKDVWIEHLLRRIDKFEENENIVVTDVRQTNEVEKLRENGFIIIKITCPESLRIERMTKLGDVVSEENLNHDTEKQVELAEADYEIINDSTKEELFNLVQILLGGLSDEN